MEKFILQPYADGYIYKHRNGSYSIETSEGTGAGQTVALALADYSEKVTSIATAQAPVEEIEEAHEEPKKRSKKNKDIDTE